MSMRAFNKWVELIRALSDYHRNYYRKHGQENEHILFMLDKMQELDKKEVEARYDKED